MLNYILLWLKTLFLVIIGREPLFYQIMRGRICFIGAAIGAIGSIVGSKIAGKDARKNAQQSQQHSDYQLQNKHQWEVADLRKAGLNPVLSAHGSGAVGSSAMAQTYNPADNVANMVSSALSAKKLKEEINLLKSQSKAAKGQAAKSYADAENIHNISDVTKNFANLNQGMHEVTSDIANSAKDVYRKKDEIVNKLKKAPADYSWYAKHKLKGAKKWLKNKFKRK